MNKKTKKGFTIVELVIVIAVIAILAAVLIPTFSNVIQKAKTSNDVVLVRNLNTALATDGKQHNTMHDAILAAKDFGFDLPQIVAKVETNKILWDSKNDVFCYEQNGQITYIPETTLTVPRNLDHPETYVEGKVNTVDYWMIAKRIEVQPQYSIYASRGFEDAGNILSNLQEGFDVGYNTGITAITYKGRTDGAAQNVVIRTDGGTLTVNANTDVVTHYNNVDKVVVKNIASESYHENGNVAVSLEVNAGHVVVEPTATVKELNVPAAATTATVSVQANSTVNTLVVDNNTATVDVNAGASITNVVAADSANVTIPESVGVAKVQKTEVGTAEALHAAVADENVKYIILTADINAGTRVTIERDLIIDGSTNKYALSASGENINNGRTLNVFGDNVKVTVKNLVIVGPTSGGFSRGLNTGDKNIDLTIDNCDISCKYYALNVFGESSGKIKITNSKLSGWAAINLWSSLTIDVCNSELIGTSISKNEGFATICFEADTTQITNQRVTNAKVTIKNSTIKSVFTLENGEGYQAMVGYNYTTRPDGADHNEFETIGCTFVYEGFSSNLLEVFDGLLIYGESTSNITILNGKKIEMDTWYKLPD